MTLKIKQEYINQILTRRDYHFGLITFNTATTIPDEYEKYLLMGFQYVFEVIDQCPTCNQIDCICITEEDIKREKLYNQMVEKQNNKKLPKTK